MPRPPSKKSRTAPTPPERPSLKHLADYLGLSPSTISFVLNNAPNRSIPEATRERIREAARRFNYQPSLIARKLQGQRIRSVGLLLPVINGYHSEILSGVGDFLMQHSYFYLTVHHRHRPELIRAYPEDLAARGVEGIIAIDTQLQAPSHLPTVLVGGHTGLPGVHSISLDSRHGADLTLQHLCDLGHRQIAFMRGHPSSADTEVRWQSTVAAARQLGLEVKPGLTVELEDDTADPESTPPPGYTAVQRLLRTGLPFTALVCFNDVSAMAAIRALHDSGRRVPEDVSVVGYDDIHSASWHVPSITTIRQPLPHMGALAAQTLLGCLHHELPASPAHLTVQPELIARESTAPAPHR